jgi:hypothetical protein
VTTLIFQSIARLRSDTPLVQARARDVRRWLQPDVFVPALRDVVAHDTVHDDTGQQCRSGRGIRTVDRL